MTSTGFIIQPPKNEIELQEFNNLLNKFSSIGNFMIVKQDGEEIKVPFIVTQAVREIIQTLSRGGAISLVSMEKELTTQQAADILNVSRPYFVKLLENNHIPFHKVGTHRKVLMKDLMSYKQKIRENRESKLSELIDLSQELGLYD